MNLDAQADRVVSAARDLDPLQDRIMIAIGGPPASGKSTLAKLVQDRLQDLNVPCGMVPMDGFHLDNQTLKQRGLLARKGAPETFDAVGFASLIEKIRRDETVLIPLFDRQKDCVIQNAGTISAVQRHVVVEGNYLFLKTPGWADLSSHWSLSVFLSPDFPVLEERLVQRWLDHGMDPKAAKHRAQSNDLANAKFVQENSDLSRVDLILS